MAVRCARGAAIACLLLCFADAGALTRGHVVDQGSFLKRFSWAVVVQQRDNRNICTGVLIAPRWVVTAAHCTGPGRHVRVGNTLRDEARPVEIRRTIRHPQYSPERQLFDIGLLELAEPVALRPLPLISRGEHMLLVTDGAAATISGWGRYHGGRRYAERLMMADIELDRLSEEPTALIFAAASTPCAGDSGGALTLVGLDGRPVLAGIASGTSGTDCRETGKLARYTKISRVLDFIAGYVDDRN